MLGNKKIIALCASQIHNSSCNQFIEAFNEHLKKINYGLLVFNTCSDLYNMDAVSKGEASVFELVRNKIVDAIVIIEEYLKFPEVVDNILNNAKKDGVPVVIIGKRSEEYVTVNFDYEAGFAEMVRHVIREHKPKKIHYMNGMRNNDFSQTRLDVFKKVLGEYNIPFSEDMVSYGDFWSVPARNATIKLIEENNVPDAMICANDTMAISVCNTFAEYGYSVPEDVIVTGFDGIEDIYYSVPRISSSLCSYAELAQKTTEILPGVIEGTITSGSFSIVPHLQLMQSCGCTSELKYNISQKLIYHHNAFNRYLEEERILAEISAKIQNCLTLDEAVEIIRSRNLVWDDVCILLKSECIDCTINPLISKTESKFGDDLCVIIDTDYLYNRNPYEFKTEMLVPELEKKIDDGCTVIFTAIHSIDIPMGYTCFYYKDYDIQKYNKISQTSTALNNAFAGFRNMRHQHYLREQIEEIYKFDTLTGLYNRGGFSKAYKHLIQDKDTLVTVVLADLDGLKFINDCYGHGEGDLAIATVAAALRHACPPQALCVRFGGDEMLAVIAGNCDENEIRNKLNGFISARNSEYDKPYEISASVGIYASQNPGELDFEDLIKTSDKLMYEEKQLKKKLREQSIK